MSHTQPWKDVLPLARAIYHEHAAGCCAHIVLDDGNLEDKHVGWSLVHAIQKKHPICIAALTSIAALSEEERQQLYNHYDDYSTYGPVKFNRP